MTENFRHFRDSFYERVLGPTERRAVFAGIVEYPDVVFKQSDILEDIGSERSVKQVREDFDCIENHGPIYAIPKIQRPSESLYVRFEPMARWIVNPWYEPEKPVPRRMVEYLCARIDPESETKVNDQLAQVDMKEGVVYAQVGRVTDMGLVFEAEEPAVSFDEFRVLKDDDPDTWGTYGFRLAGRLEAEALVIGDDAHDAVVAEFEDLMQNFIEWIRQDRPIHANSLAAEMDRSVDIRKDENRIDFELTLDTVVS